MIREVFDLHHMLGLIMTVFPAYDLMKLWDTPFVIVVKLYEMAVKMGYEHRLWYAEGFSGGNSAEAYERIRDGRGPVSLMDKEAAAAIYSIDNIARAKKITDDLKEKGLI